ncbi:glutamate racemase [Vandammella animalimorsus]|uniref:Glutamate racemase n=1 Tax=Vandammella animalimorsus TaxID=2029117 RepID=A0A2A2AFY1_9BURK|nr:glutamate racemase [Vandammella animalimorsus]PAT36654.1 glutamate racemase [Vandammella animalimorsus]
MPQFAASPIGVFDSGIGGLSILRALRQALPHERFVYFSDARHAPYGERDDAFIMQRCMQITQQLLEQERIKLLVVACNTATTVAIGQLRERFADLPIIGVEPAIKPAVQASRSGQVAVLATERTLRSRKYQALRQQWATQAAVHDVPCPGLAAAIEQDDATRIDALCARYMAQALRPAAEDGSEDAALPPVDCIVLGCTHYPLAAAALLRHAPAGLRLIDSAAAVAQQTQRRLAQAQLLASASPCPGGPTPAWLELCSNGDLHFLQRQAARHLPPH